MNGELHLSVGRLILYIAVMAVVTYLIRMIPFTLFRKEIRSVFFRSFLAYVPYAVLGAMTFPSIFFATSSLASAIAGTVVALVLAFFKRSLLTVALGASGAALAVELVMIYLL
ncbi:MAG: AzlD domain-containing protein [Clostridia bacterium]|nr:AzlD domain-containing protein [Clostridia bacterium]